MKSKYSPSSRIHLGSGKNLRGLAGTMCAAALFLAPTTATQADVFIPFDSASQYDDNFWEPSGTNRDNLRWNAGGYLLKDGSGTGSGSAAVYNSHSTGGSDGSGGTAGGLPLDEFVNFTLQADYSTSALAGGHSIGFYTKVNDASSSGYLAVFRVISATTADFRVFQNANPSNAGAGTPISTLNFTTSGSFSIDTFYTFRLEVEDVGSNVQFTAYMYDGLGGQIGSMQTFTDTDAAVTGAGQVGLRFSSDSSGGSVRMDDFAITVIPEPSTYALMVTGLLGLIALGRCGGMRHAVRV